MYDTQMKNKTCTAVGINNAVWITSITWFY